MKAFKKTIAVILAVIMVLAVTPLSFAAVDTSIIAVGDVVTFGIYEQDDNAETQDALEWLVVGKDGDALKLITKYIIDTKTPLATAQNNAGTWGSYSAAYTKFIPDFLASALTEKEKAAVIATNNNAVDQNGVALGDDLVYLPSIADITAAFATDADRVSSNTAVAAKTSKATPVGDGANYFLRDDAYKKDAKTYYANYVDAQGVVHTASADDTTVLASKSQTVGIRLMTNVDVSKLYTTGKDEATGIIPLVGTLGTHKVVWQCKCIDAEGNEKIHTFTFLDANHNAIDYQLVDHGDAAIPPEEKDIIAHRANNHQGYDFVGWDKEYSEVTEDMVITAVYEEIPEVGIIEQIFNWIKSLFVLLLSIIETEVLPVVNEWLEANLGFKIEW